MKLVLRISFITICTLTILGCQSAESQDFLLVEKEYGLWEYGIDSFAVELNLNEFDSWESLLERTEKIVCNDSVPKITLETTGAVKTIYFFNPCWKNYACILRRRKNVIRIENDTINRLNEHFFPLDSLEWVIKRNYENNGKDPGLCDHPDKLGFSIAYNDSFKKFTKTLDKLTDAFVKVTGKTDIKITLEEKRGRILSPPPAKGLKCN